jgi:hypothetical protein
MGKNLSFYIVPWETDHLIVGWGTLTQEKWLDRLTDTLTIQRAQGIAAGGSPSDGNESVEDMDGKVVQMDDLLFESDEMCLLTGSPL